MESSIKPNSPETSHPITSYLKTIISYLKTNLDQFYYYMSFIIQNLPSSSPFSFIEKDGINAITTLKKAGYNFNYILSTDEIIKIIGKFGIDIIPALKEAGFNFNYIRTYQTIPFIKKFGIDIIPALKEAGYNFSILSNDQITQIINKTGIITVPILKEAGCNFNSLNNVQITQIINKHGIITIPTLKEAGCNFNSLSNDQIVQITDKFGIISGQVFKEAGYDFNHFNKLSLSNIISNYGIKGVNIIKSFGIVNFAKDFNVIDAAFAVKKLGKESFIILQQAGMDFSKFESPQNIKYFIEETGLDGVITLNKSGYDFSKKHNTYLPSVRESGVDFNYIITSQIIKLLNHKNYDAIIAQLEILNLEMLDANNIKTIMSHYLTEDKKIIFALKKGGVDFPKIIKNAESLSDFVLTYNTKIPYILKALRIDNNNMEETNENGVLKNFTQPQILDIDALKIINSYREDKFSADQLKNDDILELFLLRGSKPIEVINVLKLIGTDFTKIDIYKLISSHLLGTVISSTEEFIYGLKEAGVNFNQLTLEQKAELQSYKHNEFKISLLKQVGVDFSELELKVNNATENHENNLNKAYIDTSGEIDNVQKIVEEAITEPNLYQMSGINSTQDQVEG